MRGEQTGNRLTNGFLTVQILRVWDGHQNQMHLRRSERFFLRLTPGEMAELEQASRKLEEPVAAILRNGAAAYIRLKGKGGSRERKEKITQ